jgi:hypothetical protein
MKANTRTDYGASFIATRTSSSATFSAWVGLFVDFGFPSLSGQLDNKKCTIFSKGKATYLKNK